MAHVKTVHLDVDLKIALDLAVDIVPGNVLEAAGEAAVLLTPLILLSSLREIAVQPSLLATCVLLPELALEVTLLSVLVSLDCCSQDGPQARSSEHPFPPIHELRMS